MSGMPRWRAAGGIQCLRLAGEVEARDPAGSGQKPRARLRVIRGAGPGDLHRTRERGVGVDNVCDGADSGAAATHHGRPQALAAPREAPPFGECPGHASRALLCDIELRHRIRSRMQDLRTARRRSTVAGGRLRLRFLPWQQRTQPGEEPGHGTRAGASRRGHLHRPDPRIIPARRRRGFGFATSQ